MAENKEIIKKKLLEGCKIRDINEIMEKFPFSPSYVGPGKWLKTLKSLYDEKEKAD